MKQGSKICRKRNPKNTKQSCFDWMFAGLIKVKYNIYTKLFTKIGQIAIIYEVRHRN